MTPPQEAAYERLRRAGFEFDYEEGGVIYLERRSHTAESSWKTGEARIDLLGNVTQRDL